MSKKETSAVLISALASVSALAKGAPPSEVTPGPQIQRLQQQQIDATKALNPRPDVLAPAGETPGTPRIANLPRDGRCFPVERIVLQANAFGWLGGLLQPALGEPRDGGSAMAFTSSNSSSSR